MKIPSFLPAAAGLAFLLAAAPASAEQNLKVGLLRCNVAAGLGLIVTSSKAMLCRFTPVRGRAERYSGTIRKFGLDIGATNKGVLVWEVFAATAGPRPGALAGDYAGVDASLTVGVGAGANALVGGFDRSFSLQPFSVQAQTGLALAAGVQSLALVSTR